MRALEDTVPAWLQQGHRVAVATVLATWGSAPRRPGAKLAVADDGRFAGSVSGGCVEAAVVEAARRALAEGDGCVLDFDVADETAWSVGLACGGRLRVLVSPWPRAAWEAVLARRAARASLELVWAAAAPAGAVGATWQVTRGPDGRIAGCAPLHAPPPARGPAAARAARACARAAPPEARRPFVAVARAMADGAPAGEDGAVGGARPARGAWLLHRELVAPVPRVVLVGGGHLAGALGHVLDALGWSAEVVDPRAAFLDAARYPARVARHVARPEALLAAAPPDAATAVVALAHDPRVDEPALAAALRGPAFYVGALGSRRTAEARRGRLAAAGLPAVAVGRLAGPIGLPVGARTPEEIAVAVAAELVAAWRAGPGREPAPAADAPAAPR